MKLVAFLSFSKDAKRRLNNNKGKRTGYGEKKLRVELFLLMQFIYLE